MEEWENHDNVEKLDPTMEFKSNSSQKRVPKQSLREDMSTERQAKNKTNRKARKQTVELLKVWIPN